MSINGGMDEEDVCVCVSVCVCVWCGIVFSHKKRTQQMPFSTTWMDLEIAIRSEVSQTQEDILYDITYTWNLKRNNINEPTKQRFTVSVTYGCQEKEGG